MNKQLKKLEKFYGYGQIPIILGITERHYRRLKKADTLTPTVAKFVSALIKIKKLESAKSK